MKDGWTADITNDPTRDFALSIDLSQNDEHRATILRGSDGGTLLRWYASNDTTDIPVQWLLGILEKAERDLK